MPELPDVEVFKGYVDAKALHQRIHDVEVSANGMLRSVSAKAVKSRLKGRQLASTRRHGKHLFIRVTGDGWLRLHFGMTGGLKYFKNAADAPDHTRLRLDFVNGYHLAYTDVRKFGQIGLVDDVDSFVESQSLGPDALAVDINTFRAVLRKYHGALKPRLLEQTAIAGIGNIYADEMLFAAGIHPLTRMENLDDYALRGLHGAMQQILRQAIDARGESHRFPSSFLLRQRQVEGKCPRCGTKLKRITVGGRTTYYCSNDQKRK
jgi:formamidopyrimidine-DNA glycosylase